MFRRLVEGHFGDNFVQEPTTFVSKEIKESKANSPYFVQRTKEKDECIRHITALPNGRLLVHIDPWAGNDYLEIYDINTKLPIKKIEIERMKSCRLLSENQVIVYRYDNNALIFDLDLNYLTTAKPSYHLTNLVKFNKDIVIGYDRNERNNELFVRPGILKDADRSVREFLEAAGYDKLGFLCSLGNDKIIAAIDNHYLSVIELKDKKFKRIGELNYYDIDEWMHYAIKMSDDHFAVVSSVSNTIFTKEKKAEVQHLRIYDTNTLKCIDDIILPKSAPVRKIIMLPDGKTIIGWDPLMKPHKIYEINLETHAQKTIKMPDRVIGLTLLFNGNLAVLLDYKKVQQLELKQIKKFKLENKQETFEKIHTHLFKDVTGIVGSYLDGNIAKLPQIKQIKIDSKALEEEIRKKIGDLNSKVPQLFQENQLKLLRLCVNFLEKDLSDEKEFVVALSQNSYTSDRYQKNSISEYIDKVLVVIRERNESKKMQDFHLKTELKM